jgi:hypothetical protein
MLRYYTYDDTQYQKYRTKWTNYKGIVDNVYDRIGDVLLLPIGEIPIPDFILMDIFRLLPL